MSGQDLYKERKGIKKSLERSLLRAHDNGVDMAEKTRAYRQILAQTMLLLESQGTKTTILKDLAKGTKEVADAEFEMIVAEVKYKASNENIMAQKKLFESIESDIKREWGQNG